MADLWQIAGHDEVAREVAEGLARGDGLQLVSGPPGVGKSWFVEAFGRVWEAAGGAVLLASEDRGRGQSSFFPFNLALSTSAGRWKAAGPLASAAARVAELHVGTGGLVTSAVHSLIAAKRQHRGRKMGYLGPAEQEVLHRLSHESHSRPLLLIADNLHWWDADSLHLLRGLLNDDLRTAVPGLDSLRVLAGTTPPPYQSVQNPDAYDALLGTARPRHHHLRYVERDRFVEALSALGAPVGIDAQLADEIYTLSGAHLALASRAADHIASRSDTSLLQAATSGEFRRLLLSERMFSLGDLGRESIALLQVASAFGLVFKRDEILCAYDGADGDAARILRRCRDERVLESVDDTFRFVHDVFRDYFGASGPFDQATLHERLGPCLRSLRPGDYEGRCQNAVRGELQDAGTLAALAALQRDRQGRAWSDALSGQVRGVLVRHRLDAVVETLVAARRALLIYEFDECLALLNQLPNGLERALLAEADYLRAMCLMSTRSEEDRRRGREVLDRWAGLENDEPELGLRLMRLLLYGLTHLPDKYEARSLEHRIRMLLSDRARFDADAIDDLYVLDRCAGSLESPDVALVRSERAAAHFAPAPGEETVRQPLEHYRSAVNHGANLICNARYADAVAVHGRIEALLARYEQGVFPRPEFPRMNGLLARYRVGAVEPDGAVEEQRRILAAGANPRDPFYANNALAVYLALSGATSESLDVFEEIEHLLRRSRTAPEPSMVYLLASNRCVTAYLGGGRAEAADEWRSMTPTLDAVAYTSAPYLRRRHELFQGVFDAELILDAEELDTHVVRTYPHEFGPLWDNYGRAFRLPEVEFWREN